jgi:hypothetical protein
MAVADLQGMAADLRRVSDTLSPQLEDTKIFSNLEMASQNAVLITRRLEGMSRTVDILLNDKTISGNLRESVIHLKRASADLEAVMADARDAVAVFPETTANLQKASADLPAITGAVRKITPETTENILAISRNLRKTSETIGGVAERVSTISGIAGGLGVQPEARIMALSSGKQNSRSDLNLDFRGPSTMFRLGVSDIGRTSGVNAQVGNRIDPNLWLRYGIVQSRFGAGVDYQPTSSLRLTGEVFDPERLRANALLDYRLRPLGDDWWLTTGWYNLFDRSQFGVGVTYRP